MLDISIYINASINKTLNAVTKWYHVYNKGMFVMYLRLIITVNCDKVEINGFCCRTATS